MTEDQEKYPLRWTMGGRVYTDEEYREDILGNHEEIQMGEISHGVEAPEEQDAFTEYVETLNTLGFRRYGQFLRTEDAVLVRRLFELIVEGEY